jgi:hypothetical protein
MHWSELPDHLIEECFQVFPFCAFEFAAASLTSVQFERFFRQCEWAAMMYAPERLTFDQLDSCLPCDDYSMIYFVVHILRPKQIDHFCRKSLSETLKYVPEWLTQKRFDSCCRWDPYSALALCAERLTPMQTIYAATQCKRELIEDLKNNQKTPKEIMKLWEVIGDLDSETASAIRTAMAIYL